MTQVPVERRWRQYIQAARQGIDEQLYREMRELGASNFEMTEWAVAEDREELAELMGQAISDHNAINLKGLKMGEKSQASSPPSPKISAATGQPVSGGKAGKGTDAIPNKPGTSTKIASGRTTSAKKEKAIREAIALEKAERVAQKQKQADEQADEMKAIMARLDARTPARRRA